jgi:HSP20 family protein
MLTRYNPFENLDSQFRLLQDSVNRLFTEEPSGRPWAPPVDILETQNELIVKADVPDVRLEDIDVHVEDGTLTIKGRREFSNGPTRQEENGKAGYHRIERSYGSFVRCFGLPDSVDPEKITADYKSGVLTVSVAKKEGAKPRSIKVNVHQ